MPHPGSSAPSRAHRPPPPLRFNSKDTVSRSSSSPIKGGQPISERLYALPPALDPAGLASAQRRARPGGFAGIPSESESRPSFYSQASDSQSQWVRRRSKETAGRPTSFRHNSEPMNPWPDAAQADLGPSEADLSNFAHHCRAFYLAASPPEESAYYISSTLASLPPSHRPIYTKLQATLRSLAHLHHLRVRISSFHALISTTYASGSLTPASRALLTSDSARAERRDKLARFVSTWSAGSGAGGVEPFFRGLWAVLRVQSRGEKTRGGAGDRRVVWEIDDAVFLESGGMEFMQEAVMILKGVLGFTDQPLATPPQLKRIRTIPKAFSDARARRKSLSPRKPVSPLPLQADEPEHNRSRAFSDPFQDRSSPIKSGTNPMIRYPPDHPGRLESPVFAGSPCLDLVSVPDEREDLLGHDAAVDEDSDDDDLLAKETDLNQPRFRLWTFPRHINDEESEDLIAQFPAVLARRKDVRFPYTPYGCGVENEFWKDITIDDTKVRVPVDNDEKLGVLCHGTGRMWTGPDMRESNWRGGLWFRFKRWWRRLFDMG